MQLQQMAETTGGQAFFPTVDEGPRGAYEKVARRDQRAVHLGYLVDQPGDGRRVAQGRDQGRSGPDLRVRARKGYFARYKTLVPPS